MKNPAENLVFWTSAAKLAGMSPQNFTYYFTINNAPPYIMMDGRKVFEVDAVKKWAAELKKQKSAKKARWAK